jgi:hypothetical protein
MGSMSHIYITPQISVKIACLFEVVTHADVFKWGAIFINAEYLLNIFNWLSKLKKII